jgi:hypothetical protein
MPTFKKKYNIDLEFAIEFITLGTCSDNIFDAEDVIQADTEYQACIVEEFGVEWDDLIYDIWIACQNEGKLIYPESIFA